MQDIVAIFLIVVWILGVISDFTLGGYIHVLLAAAVALIVWQMCRDRKNVINQTSKTDHEQRNHTNK